MLQWKIWRKKLFSLNLSTLLNSLFHLGFTFGLSSPLDAKKLCVCACVRVCTGRTVCAFTATQSSASIPRTNLVRLETVVPCFCNVSFRAHPTHDQKSGPDVRSNGGALF